MENEVFPPLGVQKASVRGVCVREEEKPSENTVEKGDSRLK